jgi:UDP-N-acetylmuramoylalanine--D-glutamate ligase
VPDWFVVEVSSFQLADIVDFAPTVGVVTNLAPDHLDRYSSVAAYYADKARLFQNATWESSWVLNGDSTEVRELAGDAPGHRFRFSIQGSEDCHAYLREGQLTLRMEEGKEETLLPDGQLPTLGLHNTANALAASLAARIAGVAPETLIRGLKGFQPLPHRLEPVGEMGGVRWVNDSKATNVAATVGALGSLEGPLVLMLGGKDKGEDLKPLRKALHPGVRGAVLYGEVRNRMEAALEGSVPLEVVSGSFEDAVAAAQARAREGDVLLLSPASSSFDMFESYVARGDRFSALARGEA